MSKKRTRRARKTTIPVAMVIGMFPLVNQMKLGYEHEGFAGAGKEAVYSMTGFHTDTGTFSVSYMKHGLLPILVGGAVHKLANMVGINRAIAGARIPLIRV